MTGQSTYEFGQSAIIPASPIEVYGAWMSSAGHTAMTGGEAVGGTLVLVRHSDVPVDHKGYEDGGWQDNYFEPMKTYFEGLAG